MSEPKEVLDCDCLRPTHSCFDDALDYLSKVGRQQMALTGTHEGVRAGLARYRLVHGICVAPDGDRYAHAWVERGDEVWQAAIVSGGEYDGTRVEYWSTRASFYETRRVVETTKYTAVEACHENLRTGHFGPWVERYRELCGEDRAKREWIGAQVEMVKAPPESEPGP